MDSEDTAIVGVCLCALCGCAYVAAVLLAIILKNRGGKSDGNPTLTNAMAPVKNVPAPPSIAQTPMDKVLERCANTPKVADVKKYVDSQKITAFQYGVFLAAANKLKAKRGAALRLLLTYPAPSGGAPNIFKYAATTALGKMKDTLGAIVAYAAQTTNASAVATFIVATLPGSGARVAQADVNAFLDKLGATDKQEAAVIMLRRMPLRPDVYLRLRTMAEEYATNKWKPKPEPPPTLQCPHQYGYKPCSDPAFNEPYNPGAMQVLTKEFGKQVAELQCCKFSNIKGDMRPEALKKVKDAKVSKVLFQVFAEVAAFFPMFSWTRAAWLAASTTQKAARAAAQGLTGSQLAAIMALSGVAEYTLGQATIGAAMDASSDQPWASCEEVNNPADWKTGPSRMVLHKFKNSEGKDAFQLHTVGGNKPDMCPVIVGGSHAVEYGAQMTKAYEAVAKSADGANDANYSQDKVCMYPMEKWVPGYKNYPAISCMQKCTVDSNTGGCKCASCRQWDETGNVCEVCDEFEGGGEWVCGQYWDNPDIIGGGWNNGHGTLQIRGGSVDRSTLGCTQA